jgi:hypothetical protein
MALRRGQRKVRVNEALVRKGLLEVYSPLSPLVASDEKIVGIRFDSGVVVFLVEKVEDDQEGS